MPPAPPPAMARRASPSLAVHIPSDVLHSSHTLLPASPGLRGDGRGGPLGPGPATARGAASGSRFGGGARAAADQLGVTSLPSERALAARRAAGGGAGAAHAPPARSSLDPDHNRSSSGPVAAHSGLGPGRSSLPALRLGQHPGGSAGSSPYGARGGGPGGSVAGRRVRVSVDALAPPPPAAPSALAAWDAALEEQHRAAAAGPSAAGMPDQRATFLAAMTPPPLPPLSPGTRYRQIRRQLEDIFAVEISLLTPRAAAVREVVEWRIARGGLPAVGPEAAGGAGAAPAASTAGRGPHGGPHGGSHSGPHSGPHGGHSGSSTQAAALAALAPPAAGHGPSTETLRQLRVFVQAAVAGVLELRDIAANPKAFLAHVDAAAALEAQRKANEVGRRERAAAAAAAAAEAKAAAAAADAAEAAALAERRQRFMLETGRRSSTGDASLVQSSRFVDVGAHRELIAERERAAAAAKGAARAAAAADAGAEAAARAAAAVERADVEMRMAAAVQSAAAQARRASAADPDGASVGTASLPRDRLAAGTAVSASASGTAAARAGRVAAAQPPSPGKKAIAGGAPLRVSADARYLNFLQPGAGTGSPRGGAHAGRGSAAAPAAPPPPAPAPSTVALQLPRIPAPAA